MTTLEAFMATARVRPQASRYWIEALFSLSSSNFESIFNLVPANLITTPARDFAMRVLETNRQRLLKAISGG